MSWVCVHHWCLQGRPKCTLWSSVCAYVCHGSGILHVWLLLLLLVQLLLLHRVCQKFLSLFELCEQLLFPLLKLLQPFHFLLLSLVPSLLLRLRKTRLLLLQPAIGMLALVVMLRAATVTPHLCA